MKKLRNVLPTIVIFAWFAGFIIVGKWIFGAYYGPICQRHAAAMGWEFEDFSVGRRRGANRRSPSCTFRVPTEDGEQRLTRVGWSEIPKSTAERLLVVAPWIGGIAYFIPLIWIVAALRGGKYRNGS